MVWAESLGNNRRLSYGDFIFASQITESTLSHLIEEGPSKGQSVAYRLAVSHEGRTILAYGNYALGSQITAAVLNHIM